jgi:hypothetical protein
MTFSSEIDSTIENFSIAPAIDHELSTSKNRVTVSFNEPLHYAQDYTISYTATDLKNRSIDTSSTFKTSSKTGFYLTRNAGSADSIQSFSIENDQEPMTVYESDQIIMYALSPSSFAVLEKDGNTKRLFYINGKSKEEIILPANKQVDELRGSSTKESYVMRLVDTESFQSSLWEYIALGAVLSEITDDYGNSIQASDIEYAPDGESIIYQDQNRVLILNNFSTDQSELNFGEFNTLRRFLPNEKAIFGYRSNKPVGIRAFDGSFIEPPEQVNTSYQAILMQDLEAYIYLAQRFNSDSNELEQFVISLKDKKETVLYKAAMSNSLLTSLAVSPNDQYVLVEEAARPTIYDDRQPNAKPSNVKTTIYSRDDGRRVMTITGFDIQWQ